MIKGSFPIRNLVIDMDGVLWRGDTPMPGLVEFFNALRVLDMGFILATNNATKTVSHYVEKLARLGANVPAEQILTSAEATATISFPCRPAKSTPSWKARRPENGSLRSPKPDEM